MFVTDVVIPVLPMQPLWRLRVPLRERLPLMGLFLLGEIPTYVHHDVVWVWVWVCVGRCALAYFGD